MTKNTVWPYPDRKPFTCTDQNEIDMAKTLKERGMTCHPWDAIRAFHMVIRSQDSMDAICRGERWHFKTDPSWIIPDARVVYDHSRPEWAMVEEATAGLS